MLWMTAFSIESSLNYINIIAVNLLYLKLTLNLIRGKRQGDAYPTVHCAVILISVVN